MASKNKPISLIEGHDHTPFAHIFDGAHGRFAKFTRDGTLERQEEIQQNSPDEVAQNSPKLPTNADFDVDGAYMDLCYDAQRFGPFLWPPHWLQCHGATEQELLRRASYFKLEAIRGNLEYREHCGRKREEAEAAREESCHQQEGEHE